MFPMFFPVFFEGFWYNKMNKYRVPGLRKSIIHVISRFYVQNDEIGILLDQSEAEKYVKLLNILFHNNFHINGSIFVHRLAARPLMATTQIVPKYITRTRMVHFLMRNSAK